MRRAWIRAVFLIGITLVSGCVNGNPPTSTALREIDLTKQRLTVNDIPEVTPSGTIGFGATAPRGELLPVRIKLPGGLVLEERVQTLYGNAQTRDGELGSLSLQWPAMSVEDAHALATRLGTTLEASPEGIDTLATWRDERQVKDEKTNLVAITGKRFGEDRIHSAIQLLLRTHETRSVGVQLEFSFSSSS